MHLDNFSFFGSMSIFDFKIHKASLKKSKTMKMSIIQKTIPMLLMIEKSQYPRVESEDLSSSFLFMRDFTPKKS